MRKLLVVLFCFSLFSCEMLGFGPRATEVIEEEDLYPKEGTVTEQLTWVLNHKTLTYTTSKYPHRTYSSWLWDITEPQLVKKLLPLRVNETYKSGNYPARHYGWLEGDPSIPHKEEIIEVQVNFEGEHFGTASTFMKFFNGSKRTYYQVNYFTKQELLDLIR
jgi:hypothetical protein